MIRSRDGIVGAVSGEDCWDTLDPTHDLHRHLELLDRLGHSWWGRSGIRKPQPVPKELFDDDKPDFLVELLPFHDHPDFVRAPVELQQMALSCGWLAYNEKTAAIEAEIVGPACLHLMSGRVAGFRPGPFRATISQALADEAFHILLVDNACRVSRQRRELEELEIPEFDLVTNMRRCQAQFPENSKQILVQLATAIVSETLITDYLSLLSSSPGIQPMNRITTEIHRRDEAAHNGLFTALGALIYHGLDTSDREFFIRLLSKPYAWFASAELGVWRSMLMQIGFPNSQRMINDCQAERRNMGHRVDSSSLDTLFTELEVEHAISDRATYVWSSPGEDVCAES